MSFVTEDSFNIKFSLFYNKFRHYPATKTIIDKKLIFDKEKPVAFYTKDIFTTSHTSSKCSKSLNSFSRGFGTIKREMTAWNIYQLMTWLDKCVDRTQT